MSLVYANSTGPCMHLGIAFSRFLLQNAFIRVKVCFIGHIIVRSNICRSFDIFSFFVFFLITRQLHLNTVEVSFSVQFISSDYFVNKCSRTKTVAPDFGMGKIFTVIGKHFSLRYDISLPITYLKIYT